MAKRGRKRKVSANSSAPITPHFFKVYLPNLSARRLKIPRAFLKDLSEALPQNIILKSSLGRFRCLELVKVGGDIFFETGWHDFVKDHALQLGDFLVFEYEGGSLFNVKIFDCSECEKEEVLTDSGVIKSPWGIKEEEQTEGEEDFNGRRLSVEGEHTQPKTDDDVFKIKEEDPETTKSVESEDDDIFTQSLDQSDELESDDVESESESFLGTMNARQTPWSPRTINLQKEKWKLITREDGTRVVDLT